MNNDLISRSELKSDLKQYFSDGTLESVSAKLAFNMILRKIDNAPTVAVNCKDCDGYEAGYSAGLKDAERPQGKWVKSKDGYTRCDQCGSRGSAIKARFCHHCGADMRKGGAE